MYANQTFQEIMGTAARDDVGVGGYGEPYGIFDRAGRPYPEDRMPFLLAVQAHETVTVDDIVIHRHDGRKVFIRARARPLFASDRSLEMVSIAFLDITREVEAQEEVQRMQRLEAVGNKYYPEASVRYGIYGDLRLLVVIRQDGSLEDIQVLSSSGYAVLDEAAIKIARKFGRSKRPDALFWG